MDPQIQSLAIQLAEAAVRNTAGAIADRITAARARKRDEETIAELENIINVLISDKSELLRIAQAFEETLVAQRVSSDEVEYITETVVPVLKRVIESSSGGAEDAQVQQFLDVIEPVISVETVTVLQLLGFNFKKAIGEPLTELVGNAIRARAPMDAAAGQELQKLAIEREAALYAIASDPDAYARFARMTGRE